jgi:hypothetical protein
VGESSGLARPLELAFRRPCRRYLPASGAEARVKRREFPANHGCEARTEARIPSLDARRAAPLRRLLRLDASEHKLRNFDSGLHEPDLQAGRRIRVLAAGSSPTTRPERPISPVAGRLPASPTGRIFFPTWRSEASMVGWQLEALPVVIRHHDDHCAGLLLRWGVRFIAARR